MGSNSEFDMPILINTGSKDFWIYPNSEWKEQDLGGFDKHDFKVRDDLFFIDVKKHVNFGLVLDYLIKFAAQ